MSFRLSRGTSHALAALVGLANSQRPWLAADRLADDFQLPRRFLAQLLQSLTRAGILESVRGSEGGYRLARPPQDITLWSVIAAVDPSAETGLEVHAGADADVAARLDPTLARLDYLIRRELSAVSLADLLGWPEGWREPSGDVGIGDGGQPRGPLADRLA